MLTPRECGEKLVVESEKYPVALVFGRENNGLSNEELQQCHFHVCIPANPDYSSLNIAAAVQTLCYEIRVNHLDIEAAKFPPSEEADYPRNEDLERFYTHLEATLKETQFIVANHPGIVMTKLRRLFNRARPEKQELNILRGILSSIDKLTGRDKKPSDGTVVNSKDSSTIDK
jgi:tRNA (cytidine32/uridine32-2'-O)-methyltransferase